jgi:hypothetical protein
VLPRQKRRTDPSKCAGLWKPIAHVGRSTALGPSTAADRKVESFHSECTICTVVLVHRSAAFGPSTAADKKRGAAQREAARFAAEAAYRQRTAETLDWLGSARIALQVRVQGLALNSCTLPGHR